MITISGPQIYTEEGILKNATLTIAENKIHALSTQKFTASPTFLFPENYHVVPGFIDVHIHGASGSDVMDGTLLALETISQALAEEGTTAYLATTMTAAPEKINDVMQNIQVYRQQPKTGAHLLGVHLEGPFLSPKKVGAQSAEKILAPRLDYFNQWQQKSDNAIRLVTIAPELAGAGEFIQALHKQNIRVSIGHTEATYAETCAAIQAGCSHVTHLFNAMRGIHQREPGTVSAALLSDKVTAELIVDGVHLHPAIVELALKVKGKEKIVLVTDAMRAKCLADGAYDLGGQTVNVKYGVASLSDGTLAGSTLKMPIAIQNLMQFTRCDLMDAVRCAAGNPAKLLGIEKQKGSIAVGKDADLVVLSETLQVVLTIVNGQIVYTRRT